MPALALLAAVVVAAPVPPPTAACGPAPMFQTQSKAPLRAQKLGELPDANLTRAVLLKIGPCSVRVVREPAGLQRPGVWRYEPDGSAAPSATPTGR